MSRTDDILCNRWVGRKINRLVSHLERLLLSYYKDKKLSLLLKQLMKEDKLFLFKPSELAVIYGIAKAQVHVDGAFAEVGVYNGSSARIICEAKQEKELYLFDTFEGLPEVSACDSRFQKGMFCGNEAQVKQRLEKFSNVHTIKGFFPSTGSCVEDKNFAFVHLDVDTYESTKTALAFFYPRMSVYGVILTHDYAQAVGVKRAFDEYFEDKQEHIAELHLTQAMIIKQ